MYKRAVRLDISTWGLSYAEYHMNHKASEIDENVQKITPSQSIINICHFHSQYSTLMPKIVNFVKILIYVAANDAQRKVASVLCVTSRMYKRAVRLDISTWGLSYAEYHMNHKAS